MPFRESLRRPRTGPRPYSLTRTCRLVTAPAAPPPPGWLTRRFGLRASSRCAHNGITGFRCQLPDPRAADPQILRDHLVRPAFTTHGQDDGPEPRPPPGMPVQIGRHPIFWQARTSTAASTATPFNGRQHCRQWLNIHGAQCRALFASSARLIPKVAPPASPTRLAAACACRRRHPSTRKTPVTASATNGDAGGTAPTHCLMRAKRRTIRRNSTSFEVRQHRSTIRPVGHPCPGAPLGIIQRFKLTGLLRVTISCAGTVPMEDETAPGSPQHRPSRLL